MLNRHNFTPQDEAFLTSLNTHLQDGSDIIHQNRVTIAEQGMNTSMAVSDYVKAIFETEELTDQDLDRIDEHYTAYKDGLTNFTERQIELENSFEITENANDIVQLEERALHIDADKLNSHAELVDNVNSILENYDASSEPFIDLSYLYESAKRDCDRSYDLMCNQNEALDHYVNVVNEIRTLEESANLNDQDLNNTNNSDEDVVMENEDITMEIDDRAMEDDSSSSQDEMSSLDDMDQSSETFNTNDDTSNLVDMDQDTSLTSSDNNPVEAVDSSPMDLVDSDTVELVVTTVDWANNLVDQAGPLLPALFSTGLV